MKSVMDFASFPTLLLVVENTLYQSIFYDCLYHSYSCFYRIYIHINILSFLDVTSPLTVGTKITHAVPRVSCGELYVFIQRLVSQRFSMCVLISISFFMKMNYYHVSSHLLEMQSLFGYSISVLHHMYW